MLYFVLAFRKTVHEINAYINSLMALNTLLLYVLLCFSTQNYVGTALKLQYISNLTSFTFLSDILVKWLPQWTCIEIWVGFLNTYLGLKNIVCISLATEPTLSTEELRIMFLGATRFSYLPLTLFVSLL